MKRVSRAWPPGGLAGFASLLGLLTLPATLPAFELPKTAVSGGGVESAAGSFVLRGTVAEAGIVGAAEGGSYRLGEGFWPPVYFLVATDVPGPEPQGIQYANGLRQSFPNPFRNRATVAFTLAKPSFVRLSVYDVAGRLVTTLVDEPLLAGPHQVHWDGRDRSGRVAASGVYFYRLDIGSWRQSKRMLKLR